MNFLQRIPLKIALFVSFTLVAIIPVFVLAAWVQHSALQLEKDSVYEKHLLLAKNISSTLTRYAQDVERIFTASAKHSSHNILSVELKQLLPSVDIRYLSKRLERDKPFTTIFGSAQQQPLKGLSALAQTISSAYQQPGSVIFSPVMLNRNHQPTIYLVTALLIENIPDSGVANKTQSVTLAALATDFIVANQQAISFGEKGHVAIVDHLGNVIAHPKEAWRLKIKNISKVKPVARMMARQTGVTTFFSPALKADMIAGYSFVPETGWGVMIPQPVRELEMKASRVGHAALGITILGLAFAIVISWWLSRYIASPLSRLTQAAKSMAKGEHTRLDAFYSSYLFKEVTELTQAFRAMTTNVEFYRENLEVTVAERTQKLQAEIVEREKIEKQIRHMASHDDLTTLPNRSLFCEHLESNWQQMKDKKSMAALLFIDLDGFKPVNDEYGHIAGDVLLFEIGQRLSDASSEFGFIARYAGDEFVILLNPLDSFEQMKKNAQKILSLIEAPFFIKDQEVMVSASIGAVFIDSVTSSETLIHIADMAMYEAKKRGGKTIVFKSLSECIVKE